MNNLDTDWQKTLNIFKNQIDDKIIFDSFFTTLQVKDIIDSDVSSGVDHDTGTIIMMKIIH